MKKRILVCREKTVKNLSTCLLLSLSCFFLSSQEGYSFYKETLQKISPRGGEIGNGKVVQYMNLLHGFVLEHPLSWNIIEMGNAVSIIDDSDSSSLENLQNIAVSFEDSSVALNSDTFENFVKLKRPSLKWKSVTFDGFAAFQAQSLNRMYLIVLKSKNMLVHIDYPINFEGNVDLYVERCLESLHFN